LGFLSKSTRKLGGDFIDFVKLSPDRWFFIVGDVSGKGLNASMSMVILKSTVRLFLREEKDFSRLIVKVNAFIKDNLPRGTFFAGVFGLFDFSKDTMYFVNCGIPVMFMFSPQFNNVIEVQGEGRVLGFVKDYAPYLKLRKISLQKGAILFISTDGIIDSESIRNERYGKERVQRCVNEFRGYNAETMVQMTLGSLQTFISGELEDDITLMALKYQCDS
jgi:serine phosphatase RsbU (regulator of sigma subunit)